MTVLRHLVRGTATLLCGVAVLAAVVAGFGAWAGFRPQPVLSGSMEPSVPVGSLAIARTVPAATMREGDVITFARPNTPGETITHRVVGIERVDGVPVLRTKGDANASQDPWTVPMSGNVGRTVATLPYAGHAALAIARPAVRGALVALFALLLLVAVLRGIWASEPTTGRLPDLV